MAILSLARGLKELRARLAAITIGYTHDRQPVTAGDIGVAGAMAVVLKDALQPNLLQTTEHTPMLVHTGPFGNIAHGNSSVLADLVGLKLADYVVTESGFGADMGFEKFMNIKCRAMGVLPDAAVIVCTVRALKMHSGRFRIAAGKPLDPKLKEEDLESVELGAVNLEKHIENVRSLGVPPVVAINRFSYDSHAEVELVRKIALRAGALDAQVSDLWERGGAGGEEPGARRYRRGRDECGAVEGPAAPAVPGRDVDQGQDPRDRDHHVRRGRRRAICPRPSGRSASTPPNGWDKMPICMAKTQYSLSDNASLKGRPSGFDVTIREIRAYTGAGFLTPISGEIMTMPGLPSNAAYQQIDLDEDGQIVGLF